jgi:hypothetical protein
MRRIPATLGVALLLLLLTMTVLATAAGASGGYTQGRFQLDLDGAVVGFPSLDGPGKDPMY